MTLLGAGSTVFALAVPSRKLTGVDRAALMVVVLSLLAGIADKRHGLEF